MDFWFGQFDRFCPLTGDIPSHPFSYLPDIAWRARQLLNGRTEDQIKALAESIGCQFDRYFNEYVLEAVDLLKSKTDLDIDEDGNIYLEPGYEDEINGFIDPENPPHDLIYGGQKCIDSESGQYLNWFYIDTSELPTESNSNEVDTLKNCEEYWDEICNIKELDDAKPYELFATLSLWLLDDAIDSIKSFKKNKSDDLFLKATEELLDSLGISSPIVPFHLSGAGECALKAMDAVCYAEHLKVIDFMTSAHLLELENKHTEFIKAKELQEQAEALKRKERAKQLNKQRHKKDHEAELLVTTEWAKQVDKFPSANKAGIFFADWLQQHGMKYEPCTATGWIRKYAKKHGIKLR